MPQDIVWIRKDELDASQRIVRSRLLAYPVFAAFEPCENRGSGFPKYSAALR
jgi:hypothetical protein